MHCDTDGRPCMSKLGCFFIEPSVKVDGRYYEDALLSVETSAASRVVRLIVRVAAHAQRTRSKVKG